VPRRSAEFLELKPTMADYRAHVRFRLVASFDHLGLSPQLDDLVLAYTRCQTRSGDAACTTRPAEPVDAVAGAGHRSLASPSPADIFQNNVFPEAVEASRASQGCSALRAPSRFPKPRGLGRRPIHLHHEGASLHLDRLRKRPMISIRAVAATACWRVR